MAENGVGEGVVALEEGDSLHKDSLSIGLIHIEYLIPDLKSFLYYPLCTVSSASSSLPPTII